MVFRCKLPHSANSVSALALRMPSRLSRNRRVDFLRILKLAVITMNYFVSLFLGLSFVVSCPVCSIAQVRAMIGSWNNIASGEDIEIKPNYDIIYSNSGRARISLTTYKGANIVINSSDFQCYYYATFTGGGMNWQIKQGGPECIRGRFTRNDDSSDAQGAPQPKKVPRSVDANSYSLGGAQSPQCPYGTFKDSFGIIKCR